MIFVFRFMPSPTSRVYPMIVYSPSDSVIVGRAMATDRIQDEYPEGCLLPVKPTTYADPKLANSALPSGLLDMLSQTDLRAFLADYPADDGSSFARECKERQKRLRKLDTNIALSDLDSAEAKAMRERQERTRVEEEAKREQRVENLKKEREARRTSRESKIAAEERELKVAKVIVARQKARAEDRRIRQKFAAID